LEYLNPKIQKTKSKNLKKKHPKDAIPARVVLAHPRFCCRVALRVAIKFVMGGALG